MSRLRAAALCIAIFWASAAHAAAPDLGKAAELMREGKPAEAYKLLEPFEFEMAGVVEYDYLLGISALDSGNPAKATFVFERVLAVDPNYAGARLDMARAYYQLGDLPRAKKEFQTVLALNPPPFAKATIKKYLAAIEERETGVSTKLTGYVEGAWGHDDNINNALSQAQIAVPAFNNLLFTLNPTNLQTGDGYVGINAGIDYDHHFNHTYSAYAGTDLRNRSYSTYSNFNMHILDERVGMGFGEGKNVVRAGYIGEQYDMGSSRFMNMNGVNMEWRHVLDSNNMLDVGGQYTAYRFPQVGLNINDFNQKIASLAWMHAFSGGDGLFFSSLFIGNQQAVNGRADGDASLKGIRLGGQYKAAPKFDLFASMGGMVGSYGKQNAAFQMTRRDNAYDLAVGMIWHYDKYWSLKPQVKKMRNLSNIAIYQFDMTDVSVTLRRDFQ
jgi:tetratricopeptide (TPR) repeat protein